MKRYLVGGAVRDALLKWPVKEKDWVVVGATPELMLSKNFKPVGKDFPVFLHPRTHEEHALARTERKVDKGYTGFTVHASPDITLEEDLVRRDLTINAMAQTPGGKLIDPYRGLSDLKSRTLRHVSKAFVEDPVRILRTARFAARYASFGFTVAPETNVLMREMVNNGEVNALVPERVWQELAKALSEIRPSRFFEVLKHCGALAVLFPEIDHLFGIPSHPGDHIEVDTGMHTMHALNQAARLEFAPIVRFAVLTHCLGKLKTSPQDWPLHPNLALHSIELIQQFCTHWRVPNDYKDLALITATYHHRAHDSLSLRPDALLQLLTQTDAFRRPERFEYFLQACEADSRSRLGLERVPYIQGEWLREIFAAAHNIDTKKITHGKQKGPEIAEAIKQLRLETISALSPKGG